MSVLRFPLVRRKPPGDPSDEELVRRIQYGDSGAWAQLLERYSDPIYTKAYEYCRTGAWMPADDLADEVSDLYLFIVQHVQKSLDSFQGRCKVKTWINHIVYDRRQIVKSYLLHKYPDRADTRLPKIMQHRLDVEKEIFKRLVWGLMPDRISWELGLSEAESEEHCEKILQLLKAHSRRVYERIMANRMAVLPNLSLDQLAEEEEGGRPRYEPVDPGPSPEEALVEKEMEEIVWGAVKEVWDTVSKDEKRLLVLIYDQEMRPSEIAKSADCLRLSGMTTAQQIYYHKDRVLRKMSEGVEKRWTSLEREDADLKRSEIGREALDVLEEVWGERGVRGLE